MDIFINKYKVKSIFEEYEKENMFYDSHKYYIVGNLKVYEPLNTFTTIFYIIVSMSIYYDNFKYNKNFRNIKLLYSFATFWLGIGSALFHGFHLTIFHILDEYSMLLIIYSILLFKLNNLYKLNYVLLSYFLILLIPFLKCLIYFKFWIFILKYANYYFISLILFNVYFFYKNNMNKSFYDNILIIKGFIYLNIGSVIWILDKSHIYSLHYLWHILTSLAILYVYLHFRKEEKKKISP